MSEKRFYYGIFDDGTEYIEDYKKEEYYFDLDDVEKLLKEQQDKISELEEELEKSSAFIIEQRKENKTLKKENEQLRQEIVHLKDNLKYYKTKSARLEEELLSTRGCMYE